MTVLSRAVEKTTKNPDSTDAPIITLWLWTYASSVLAHAVFLGLPASAAWGGAGMGVVVLPLAVLIAVAGRRSLSVAGLLSWRGRPL